MAIHLNFKCNESWEQMPENNTGRYCDKCDKNIYDLTDKSEAEIKVLHDQNNGKLCGKIKPAQLQMPFVQHQKKYALAQFCLALFLAFGSMLFSYEASAQHKLGEVVVSQKSEAFIIKGKVLDKETGEPLTGVNISVPEDLSVNTATTDKRGNYVLYIERNQKKTTAVDVIFSSIGYEELKITNIKLDRKQIVLDVQLNYEKLEMLGDVIFIEEEPLIEPVPQIEPDVNIDDPDHN